MVTRRPELHVSGGSQYNGPDDRPLGELQALVPDEADPMTRRGISEAEQHAPAVLDSPADSFDVDQDDARRALGAAPGA